MNNSNTYGGVFCTPDERQVSTLGTGYYANYVSGGGINRAGSTLTNKRVYFSGSVYTRNAKGRFVSFKQRKIVNTRDVTGTGYDFYRPLYLIWWGILSAIASIFVSIYFENPYFLLLGLVLLITFIIAYFIKRKTLLSIEYAGGNIAFDVRWIQKHEQDDFIRNIHLVKDNLYSNAAELQGFVTAESLVDAVPEL